MALLREHSTGLHLPAARQHFNRAELLRQKGLWREAAAAWVAGLELEPGSLAGLLGLAEACKELGLTESAMTALTAAARFHPSEARVWALMGDFLRSRGMFTQAAECYLTALKARPAEPELRFAYGSTLLESNQARAAASVLRTLTAWRPHDARVWLHLGVAARLSGEGDEAVAALRRALQLEPKNPAALVELGVLCRQSRRYEEAAALYREALQLQPDFIPALTNFGNLNVERLRLDEAEQFYAKVLALDPHHAPTHCSRAMLWLLRGRFKEGWREYEWRWRQPGMQHPVRGNTRWNGEASVAGRTVLVYAEQGAGDTVQFIRYARLLRERGARVLLACREELVRLMENQGDLNGVLKQGDPLENVDLCCPLLDLPGAFRTELDSIPAYHRYLAPPPSIAPDSRILQSSHRRIGLAWAGNPHHPNDRNRSCPLERLHPLFQLPGMRIYSFQVGPAARQLGEMLRFGAIPLGPVLTDYAVTAANLDQMDAVVTVDTSIAHLAGALGKPTAILLPYSPDWRWLLDRVDSPWYPSVRLLRQRRPGDWDEAVEEACAWLRNLFARG